MSQDRNTNRLGHRRPAEDRVTRASQSRLVILIGLFLMVLAMMQLARQPSTWRWMWQMNNPGIPSEVDPRLKPSSPPRQTAESFVSPSEEQAADDAEGEMSGLTIDPERIANIEDDTYFRPAEKDTWFDLFSRLQNASDEELLQQSLGAVSTLQLYRQPRSYRGKLVDVHGTVRRAHRVIAPENEQGIESYWQLWLFEGDGSAVPCVVYALQLPSGFPEGMSVAARVDLTGFSYKRWAYQGAEGDLMVAPVVLAKSLRWLRTQEAPRSTPSSEQVLWSIALALALSYVVVRWTLIWSGRSGRRAVASRDTKQEPVDFDFLNENEGPDGSS